jgi:hypothetical protein
MKEELKGVVVDQRKGPGLHAIAFIQAIDIQHDIATIPLP